MYRNRIGMSALWGKVMSPREASGLIKDGMTVGLSGFNRAGEAKAVPIALAERARDQALRIDLVTGASIGSEVDKSLAESHSLARRMPFQADPALRAAINRGEVMYIDQHLSETVDLLRTHQLKPIDVAVIEAIAITADGGIVPTTSVGNSASLAMMAEQVIVEINLAQPLTLMGMHDLYIPTRRPYREAFPLTRPSQRIGLAAIPVEPSRIKAIVITDKPDAWVSVVPPDQETADIAGFLIEFLQHEVRQGRLDNRLAPLQAGVGSIANAVLHGFQDSPFHDLEMYSEVLQDSTFDLFDSGKLVFASASSMTLSQAKGEQVYPDLAKYRDRIVLRPQEVSNSPEIIRRLGIIAINTALEADLYGNVNSTHVGGTHMMNGIGGSGDFARNAQMAIFVTKSIAKGGRISSIVPMVSHTDHAGLDVDLLVTEQGLADLRGLAPVERARRIIANCVHPGYRDAAAAYLDEALLRGGETPHVLEKAFSWHAALREHGTMLPSAPLAAE
ncbi:succinyl-CoA:coenzyme A transferase [mine drainage metagenome]|uniref:Succinyl-CoA:coenzyme A transferase n=1 Tax=mine drainage metagenome TaxID=410659 RepID=A0A1J5S013_9ZZZZ